MIKKLLGLMALCLAATSASAQATRPVVYVANSMGDDVTVIDMQTQKVISTIKVGPIVHGVCAPANGRLAFVTIESEHALKVIDTRTNAVTDTIALPGQPNECAATSDGHYVVVPLLAPANSAVIIDMTTKTIVKSLEVRHPHNCFTPEGGSNTIVYCEARDLFRIDRIDLTKMDFTDHYRVGGDPRPFIVTADEKMLYTALSGLHGVAMVNLVNRTEAELALPPMQLMSCRVEPPNTPTHGLALSKDGKKLWITSVADSGIYVYDLARKKLSKKIIVGACPNWISMSADGKYVAISNADSDDVSILDARREKEIARVKVGKAPKRLLVINVPQGEALQN